MKHCLYILTLLTLTIVSCGPKQNEGPKTNKIKVNDSYKPAFTVNQLCDKLEFSFSKMQVDSFEQIFIDWNKTIKSNTDNFINQNDTINSVFNVYKEFYKPLDLLKLGNWEWGNALNENSKYVVVQNKIFYSVIQTENFNDINWSKLKKDSIINFRPPLDLDKNKILYLTDEYAESINKFLGTESTQLGEENIMNPSIPEGETEKRYEILRSYIPLLLGHWGSYWHLETHPDISIIIFNKSLTKAKIDFRVGYQGGEAILEKNGNNWIIKESKETWIE